MLRVRDSGQCRAILLVHVLDQAQGKVVGSFEPVCMSISSKELFYRLEGSGSDGCGVGEEVRDRYVGR